MDANGFRGSQRVQILKNESGFVFQTFASKTSCAKAGSELVWFRNLRILQKYSLNLEKKLNEKF